VTDLVKMLCVDMMLRLLFLMANPTIPGSSI